LKHLADFLSITGTRTARIRRERVRLLVAGL